MCVILGDPQMQFGCVRQIQSLTWRLSSMCSMQNASETPMLASAWKDDSMCRTSGAALTVSCSTCSLDPQHKEGARGEGGKGTVHV